MATDIFSNIAALIIVLGVLVFFHEFGHFIVARFFGVGVEKFSLGFGPRLFGKKVGMTDYRVSAIPLGGYVKMVGEEPDAEIPDDMIPFSFTHKSVYKRMAIVIAGPLFNVLLAILIFWGLFTFYGAYEPDTVIGKVAPDSPALAAGLKDKDRILSIEGKTIENWGAISEAIKSCKGREVDIRVKRGSETLSFTVKPKLDKTKNVFGEEVERYLIGVESSGNMIPKEMSVGAAFTESFKQTWSVAEITVVSMVKMVQGKISKKELGGPIMIAQMAGAQAREGIPNLIWFIALISVNLAVLNILPIPVLDGGHMVFFTIEAIKGSPVSENTRMTAQQIGMLLLLILMIFVFYNDLTRNVPM
jgi:regulator of sigma E protease